MSGKEKARWQYEEKSNSCPALFWFIPFSPKIKTENQHEWPSYQIQDHSHDIMRSKKNSTHPPSPHKNMCDMPQIPSSSQKILSFASEILQTDNNFIAVR